MWTCPKCMRSFKRSDQQHSCVLISKQDLFGKRPAVLQLLYDEIKSRLKGIGDYREETVPPDVIYFKTKSTFLAIKVKKDFLEVEFFLDHHTDAPVVSKWLQTSKNRFVHVVPIDNASDITNQLIQWIKFSYGLILT